MLRRMSLLVFLALPALGAPLDSKAVLEHIRSSQKNIGQEKTKRARVEQFKKLKRYVKTQEPKATAPLLFTLKKLSLYFDLIAEDELNEKSCGDSKTHIRFYDDPQETFLSDEAKIALDVLEKLCRS